MEHDTLLQTARVAHERYADPDGFLTARACGLAADDLCEVDADVADFLADQLQYMDRPVRVDDVMVSLAWALEVGR
jgi:hypothetical protein